MNDRALRKAGGSNTWAVDTNQFFNNFRLYITGCNSNNHWYLACSGMELYGKAFGGIVSQRYNAKIVPQQKPLSPSPSSSPPHPMNIDNTNNEQPNLNTNTFDYVHDFDANGIVHFLATKCNTQQWKNPAQLGTLSVRTSGLMEDSHPAHCIVGKQTVRCVTKPLKHAWVIIDFDNYAIK